MMSGIVWKTVQALRRWRFAPVDEPKRPHHPARCRLVNGVPDLCCEQHQCYPRPVPWTGASLRLK